MEMEVVEGMKEWRRNHPKATMREIEAELDEQMGRMRAKLLGEIAANSWAVDWEKGSEPKCPQCGAETHKRGKGRRRLRTAGGESIEIERSYAVCPECGVGFFPPG